MTVRYQKLTHSFDRSHLSNNLTNDEDIFSVRGTLIVLHIDIHREDPIRPLAAQNSLFSAYSEIISIIKERGDGAISTDDIPYRKRNPKTSLVVEGLAHSSDPTVYRKWRNVRDCLFGLRQYMRSSSKNGLDSAFQPKRLGQVMWDAARSPKEIVNL